MEDKTFEEKNQPLINGLNLMKTLGHNQENFSGFQDLFNNLIFYDENNYAVLPKYKTYSTRKSAFEVLLLFPSILMQNIMTHYKIFLNFFLQYQKSSVSLIKRLSNKPKGLKNFGSTCYLNSVVHLLHSVISIKQEVFLSFSDEGVVHALAYLFAKLEHSFLSSVNSHILCKNYRD